MVLHAKITVMTATVATWIRRLKSQPTNQPPPALVAPNTERVRISSVPTTPPSAPTSGPNGGNNKPINPPIAPTTSACHDAPPTFAPMLLSHHSAASTATMSTNNRPSQNQPKVCQSVP